MRRYFQPPTRSVRLPESLIERGKRLAVALTALEGRVVPESEAIARATERGLDAMAVTNGDEKGAVR